MRRWGTSMAIVGTVLTAAAILFIALGTTAMARGILGDSSASLGSVLLPTFVAGAACAVLVVGLLRRSRVAYVVAALIGVSMLALWANLMLGSRTSPFELIPLFIVIPPALIVLGLGFSWRDFWRPDTNPR